MRSILSNSRRPEITLREEADTLTQYLQVEQFCRENKFDFVITFDPDLDPDDIKIPPMLLQPFVENAVVHGVANLTRPGMIKVHFHIEEPFLQCVIEDNGIGREAAAQRRQERKPGHQPAAMQITRERLESMTKNKEHEALVISDILNEEGAVCGTKVIVSYEL
jgi:LytS/YehU family sensor histidine kinase